ncbi:hypothetical protein P9139_10635 [Curtobacterium flaccumfaciens]|nr:hypothetical protein P9139_10635 [Curtobacterium flaccumfaciens]
MFEYEGMQAASVPRSPGAQRESTGRSGAARPVRRVDHLGDARVALERITSLRSRVAEMEPTRVDTEGLPTAEALAPLLPGARSGWAGPTRCTSPCSSR